MAEPVHAPPTRREATARSGCPARWRARKWPVLDRPRLAREFIAALTRSARLRLDGSRLTLLDAPGRVLAVLEAQTQTLATTAWDVTGYNNGKQAVVSIITAAV